MKHNGKNGQMSPDLYDPVKPQDLIGDARKIATRLLKAVDGRKGALKAILYGSPGCGKSTLVKMVCRKLTNHALEVEKVNGRLVTVDMAREWQRNLGYGSLFGGWKVKHIEEIDLIAQVTQDVMLTYLDDLPASYAVIGTSNMDLENLTERFQTRFQLVHLHGPTSDELATWLNLRWHVPRVTADFIVMGSGSNVREALLAAQGFSMFGKVEMTPKSVSVVDPARSAAARRAWETIRERRK